MAQFTRVNGDFQPVAVYDNGTGNAYTNSGNTAAITSATTVQPQGPALQFFTVAGNAATLVTYDNAVFQTVEQLATVMIYEANTSPTDNTIAFATYPVGAWTATTLQNALANGLANAGASNSTTTVTLTATFTN